MAQRPAAPTLSPAPDNNKLAYIEFDVPTAGAPTHAMVRIHDVVTDRTHMYDAQTQKLLPVDEMGKLVTLAENGRMPTRKRLSVAGLWAGTFTSTVAFARQMSYTLGTRLPTARRSSALRPRLVARRCSSLSPIRRLGSTLRFRTAVNLHALSFTKMDRGPDYLDDLSTHKRAR